MVIFMTNNSLSDINGQLEEIVRIIEKARENAYKAVNVELINIYWEIGHYISDKVQTESWGKSVVADFSKYVKDNYPDIKGFSQQNIWRMKQFYETYKDKEKLSPLVREISWSNNLVIMTGAKAMRQRNFICC